MTTFLREMRLLGLVFLGGFLGTIVRYGLTLGSQYLWGKEWPVEIVIVNLTGAFLLAYLSSWLEGRSHLQHLRLLWGVGFLGAYTTFSSLMLGVSLMLEKQQWFSALSYLLLSFVGGLAMTWCGVFCARMYANWSIRVEEKESEVF